MAWRVLLHDQPRQWVAELAAADTETGDWVAAAIDALKLNGPPPGCLVLVSQPDGPRHRVLRRLPQTSWQRRHIRIWYRTDPAQRIIHIVEESIIGSLAGGACDLIFEPLNDRQERRWPYVAPLHAGPHPVPRSLRWVRNLLPGDVGPIWFIEVMSCLAETPDPGERRRYVRSYRRNVPRLVWTSWTEHLITCRQR